MWMFIAVLLIIAKTWKQSRSSSVTEWINRLVLHIQTTKYYSALKRNQPSSHEEMKNIKCILVSEKSQSEKAIYCVIPTT